MVRKGFLLSLCLSWCSAALAQGPTLSPPRTVWDTDVGGLAQHRQSGLQCPPLAGDFHRSAVAMIDRAGLDVSCTYKTEHANITFHLALPDKAALPDAFDAARKALGAGATPRPDILPAPPGRNWLQAGYVEKGGTVRTDLLLGLMSGWLYEIRATYRPEDADAVNFAIADVNAVAMKTAGQHLAACAKAPAPAVGQPIDSGNSTLTLGLTMGGLLRADSITQFDESALWCALHGAQFNAKAYVYWRNLAPGAKGMVDRIASVDGNDQIMVVSDPKGAQLASGVAPGAKVQSVYDLLVDDKDNTTLMGFYDGRPSLDMIAHRLADHSPAFAQVRKDDKKTTVFWKPPAKP